RRSRSDWQPVWDQEQEVMRERKHVSPRGIGKCFSKVSVELRNFCLSPDSSTASSRNISRPST
ncbi:hypothetical protein KUCAC02_024700, partial [Chaenocephalus aceratus]